MARLNTTTALIAACALVALARATPVMAQTAPDSSGGWFDPDSAKATDAKAPAKAAPRPAAAPQPQPAPAPAQPAADGSYADADPSALTDFRPALDSYGYWVQDPTYG